MNLVVSASAFEGNKWIVWRLSGNDERRPTKRMKVELI